MLRKNLFILVLLLTASICLGVSCTDNDDSDDADSDGGDNESFDDDDDNDDDDNDDDNNDDNDNDDDQGPVILGSENTTCKNGAPLSRDEDPQWPESLTLEYLAGILTVHHVNGFFNCCLDTIDVSLVADGYTLSLYEQEVAANPCFCECPFDVNTEISNLAPGLYTVNVYVNGEFSISEDVTVTSGCGD